MSFFESLSQVDLSAPSPSADQVDWLHANVSTDADNDIHHRLGFGRSEAARGDHTHDGTNSQALWDKSAIPGNGADTTINAILALLRLKSA